MDPETTNCQNPNSNPNPNPKPRIEEDEDLEELEDDEDDTDFEDEDDDDEEEKQETPSSQKENLEALIRRLSSGPMRLGVHDVIIKGNQKTKESLIEDEVLDLFRSANTMQELMKAASIANARLQRMDVFDSVIITLDDGPKELPGTANVVVEEAEFKSPFTGNVGIFSNRRWKRVRLDNMRILFGRNGRFNVILKGASFWSRTWSLEGSLKWKNFFGYADIWDLSGSYGWDQATELSAGLSLPRFKALPTPSSARVSLLSQDWLKFSSYKEHLFGISLGLLSARNHDLSYNLTWRRLTDPSHMGSKSIRRQLGHSLLSSIKYSYKIDRRDSQMRPTKGYAFLSSTQLGGLGPDSKSLRFIRQEFDIRAALPLGFFNSALNFGVAAGAITPWGSGFLNLTCPLPDRFYIGGNTSPVCTLSGPTSLLGFKTRGLGPTDSRRLIPNTSNVTGSQASAERDYLGDDLVITAFADLSFDLPLELFRKAGIHGHVFASAGNLSKLTEGGLKNFSPQFFLNTA